MWRGFPLIICVTVMLAGCATTSNVSREQMKTLPQHYSQFDVNMAWDVKTVGGKTVINGFVRNVRYAIMEELEIWVALHDAKGKLLGRAVDFVIPRRLDMNETAPFEIKLPMVADPGGKFIFTYKYVGSDGGGDDGASAGGAWMQSFESSVIPVSNQR